MHHLLMSDRAAYPSVELVTPIDRLEWVCATALPPGLPQLQFQTEGGAGFSWPDFIRPNSAIPLFSFRLRDVLVNAGVDGIEFHPAVVVNRSTGESRQYVAANVMRLLAAMDRQRSEFVPGRLPQSVMVRSIDKLVLDAEACNGHPLFRLAEYDLLVVISEEVAQALADASLTAVVVMEPQEWDGFAD